MSIFNLLGRNTLCFTVDGLDRLSEEDPYLVTRLERALAQIGAIPAHVDVRAGKELFCVSVENPDLRVEDITEIFSKERCTAHLKGDD